jgi:hypothetical protein
MTEEIVLTRRTESLRQEAAEALLWLAENVGIKVKGGCLEVATVGTEAWTPPCDELEKYESLINLKRAYENDK